MKKISRKTPTFLVKYNPDTKKYSVKISTWFGFIPMVLLIWRFPFIFRPVLGWGSGDADWMDALITPYCKLNRILLCQVSQYNEPPMWHVINLSGIHLYTLSPPEFQLEENRENDCYVFGEKRNGEFWTCVTGMFSTDCYKSMAEMGLNDKSMTDFTVEKIFKRLEQYYNL